MNQEMKDFWRICLTTLALCAALIAVAHWCGCRTAVSISLKDSSGINVGNVSFEETSWPVVSYFTGPTFKFWIRRDTDAAVWVTGSAALTNSTSALGLYNSAEAKELTIAAGYNAPTNAPAAKGE